MNAVRNGATAGVCLSLVTLFHAQVARADDATLVQSDDTYYKQADQALNKILQLQKNTNQAKNVILFVGDGMGFSTVTATRIFEGQQRGIDGEFNVLAGEAFPYLAASKTYSHDAQITDFGAQRGRHDDRGQDPQRSNGPRPYSKARLLQRPERLNRSPPCGRWQRRLAWRRVPSRQRGSPTRRLAQPMPISPIEIGKQMPACRPRLFPPVAPILRGNWSR